MEAVMLGHREVTAEPTSQDIMLGEKMAGVARWETVAAAQSIHFNSG